MTQLKMCNTPSSHTPHTSHTPLLVDRTQTTIDLWLEIYRDSGIEELLQEMPKKEKEEFEAIANCLADDFQMYTGAAVPLLSDYAVSRAGV
ncbi:MAG: hypothetical protein F6K14_32315 [Symploca sp. SIO2C1]|nr:hypothetical protein [Symploca sp. SIO2C1]